MGGASQWIGKSVKRREDPRLLTGRGTFVDDLPFQNLHHAAILRSPHAHARIRAIDASEALKAPGVVGVITGTDAEALTRPFSVGVLAPVKYYCLAVGKARFVGEPVAVVVARDRYLLARFHENVYMEIAGLPPQRLLTYFPDLERVADKVLFGSDWPSVPTIKKNLDAIRGLPLPDKAKAQILGDNAARVLKLGA